MTPVERGARALALEQSGVDEWDALDEAFQERLKEQVRAVLQAIREPSDAVTDAGIDMLTERGCNPLSGDAEAVWQAMIDTALVEGSEG